MTNPPMGIFATNRGLYLLASPAAQDTETDVVKLHGDPAVAGDWSTARPALRHPGVIFGAPAIYAIAPVDPYGESDRAFDFYWVSTGGWGRYTQGAAPVRDSFSGSTFDPIRGLYVSPETIASGGNATQRSWYIERAVKGDGTNQSYGVYQDDGSYTGAGTVADRFSNRATPSLSVAPSAVLAHPTQPLLYIGSGNGLYVYDKDQAVRSYTFAAQPVQGLTDLAWAQGDLYFSYNTDVWKLVGGTGEPNLFATLPTGSPASVGRFCITGSELFLTNGEAVDLQTKARRNWVRRGALSGSQGAQAEHLLQSIDHGIYCSQAKATPEIYAMDPDKSSRLFVLRIAPLAR